MEQDSNSCHGKTRSGKACPYKGRFEHEAKKYCKNHLPLDECSVCYEAITGRGGIELPCKHLYHTKCLRKWVVSNHATCPYCRATLPEEVIERLCPVTEHATRTFIIDFRGNLDATQMTDLQRFVMTLVNAHVLSTLITTPALALAAATALPEATGLPSDPAPQTTGDSLPTAPPETGEAGRSQTS